MVTKVGHLGEIDLSVVLPTVCWTLEETVVPEMSIGQSSGLQRAFHLDGDARKQADHYSLFLNDARSN
jgi:hypothetical protein